MTEEDTDVRLCRESLPNNLGPGDDKSYVTADLLIVDKFRADRIECGELRDVSAFWSLLSVPVFQSYSAPSRRKTRFSSEVRQPMIFLLGSSTGDVVLLGMSFCSPQMNFLAPKNAKRAQVQFGPFTTLESYLYQPYSQARMIACHFAFELSLL